MPRKHFDSPEHTSIVFTWQHCARSYIVFFSHTHSFGIWHMRRQSLCRRDRASKSDDVIKLHSHHEFIIAQSYTRKMCGVHVFQNSLWRILFLACIPTNSWISRHCDSSENRFHFLHRCHILARMHRKFHYIPALDKLRHTNREHLRCHRSRSILPNFFFIFFFRANFPLLLDPEGP